MLQGFHPAHAETAWNHPSELDGLDVVILGAGIAGTQLAARLARKGARVVLVAGKALPSKRLVDGCSLRRAAIQHMSAAIGMTAAELAEILQVEQSGFFGMRITNDRDETPRFEGKHSFAATDDEWIGLSARHADIICALRHHMPSKVQLVAAEVERYRPGDHALEVRLGERACEWPLAPRSLCINTTGKALAGASTPASHYVVALQQPIRSTGTMLERDAWAPSFTVGERTQLGFVTPFFSSVTPDATHYAINTTVVDAATLAQVGDEALLAETRTGLDRCVAALGMTPCEPHETTGGGVVPVANDFSGLFTGGIVDLHNVFSPGAPAINVDGMLAHSVGVTALVAALDGPLSSLDTWQHALRRATQELRPIRRWNRFIAWNYFKASYRVREMNRRVTKLLGKKVVRDWATLGA